MTAEEEIWVSGPPSDQVRYEAQERGGAVFIRGDGHGGIDYRVATAEEILAERSALADHQPGQTLGDAIARNSHDREGLER